MIKISIGMADCRAYDPNFLVGDESRLNSVHMNGFTDIHTHILPSIDDGAKDMVEARELVRMAWENGTRTMILTPHYRGVYKRNTPVFLRESFDIFCDMIAGDFPGLKLYLGNEVHYQTEVPERLAARRILPLCDSKYVLLEFSSRSLHSQVVTGVLETIRWGYVPIIAHAERYDVFCTDSSLADEVLELGALIQLNADSVMGVHGSKVKRFCHNLLKEQKVHFIASDAHDPHNRPPLLRDCFLRVNKKYGSEFAAQVFYGNAQAVIENHTI